MAVLPFEEDFLPDDDDIDMITNFQAFNSLEFKVYDEDDEVWHHITMPMLEFIKLRKQQEKLEEEIFDADDYDVEFEPWDYDSTLLYRNWVSWHFTRFKHLLDNYRQRLEKEKELEGKECPVLHIPLTAANAKQVRSCKHWLSDEALEGMKKAADTPFLNCPLCRQQFHHICGVN